MPVPRMQPTVFKTFDKRVFGFDIETVGDRNEFICASVWNDEFTHTYLKREEFIEDMLLGVFDDAIIVATNLSFDFFGTFFGTPFIDRFNFLFRGSDLLAVETFRQKKEFFKEPKQGENRKRIIFLDTLNYAKMSVASLGKLIGVPKMKSPDFLGTTPMTREEWDYLIAYNKNDAMVSQKAFLFFIKSFQRLGANFKRTIASSAMSLYTNKYLKETYYISPKDAMRDMLKGYYGGRTEAFHRGKIEGYYYYDVNSLYPTMMKKEFPDPNSFAVWKSNLKTDNFRWVTGMSLVDIECPMMKYPLLPYRSKKLYFPIGRWTGWYTHAELCEAIDAGYIVHDIKLTYAYKKTCTPMKEYVEDLYAKRLQYKREGSPMELVVKILMNSLYGKFAQKFELRENIVKTGDVKEVERLRKEYLKVEPLRYGFFRVVCTDEPKNFSFPIWSAYVTAYGRIHIWKLLRHYDAIYCDTDSLITRKKIPTGKEIGELKLEHEIEEGLIVKPKFYFLRDKGSNEETFKAKGVHLNLDMDLFFTMLRDKKVDVRKFMKFKEVLRRTDDFVPNEILRMTKVLNLEDDKRRWPGKFRIDRHQESRPLTIDEIHTQEDKIGTTGGKYDEHKGD